MNICRHLSYTRSLSPGKALFFYQTTEVILFLFSWKRIKLERQNKELRKHMIGMDT